MDKKRLSIVILTIFAFAIFLSVSASTVIGACCVYEGAEEVTCDDVTIGPEETEAEVQAACEDADGDFYTDDCTEIEDCPSYEECTEDTTTVCPDGTEIVTEECEDGQRVSTGITCDNIEDVCSDGEQGDYESDVDCGGICGPCHDGMACSEDSDCESGSCVGNVCEPAEEAPECSDGIDNDGDGLVDMDDPGCDDEQDDTEEEVEPSEPELPGCGDGECVGDESSETCPEDCGICGDGIVHNEECDPAAEDPDAACFSGECNEYCECGYECSEGTVPVPESLYTSYSEGSIILEWYLDTGCELERIDIRRCETEGEECTPRNVVSSKTERDSSYTFNDEDIAPENTYCYMVKAYYKEEGAVASSETLCFATGHEKCMQGRGTFCENNIVYGCDSNNNPVEQINCNEETGPAGLPTTCVERNDGSASCEASNICDRCNGVFGMFGFTEGIEEGGPWGGIELCSEMDLLECFFDRTTTNIDKFHFCGDVNSCYDYGTEEVCEENKCGMGSLGETGEAEESSIGCEWKSSPEAAEEFGVGVCRPKDEEMQSCSACETTYSDKRNAFFGRCSDAVCRLYGDCYFHYGCYDSESLGCRAYDNKEDCTGSGDSAQDVEVDVEYDENTRRTGITNEITERSNDYFSYGTCRWIEDENPDAGGHCVKDADGDEEADCEYGDGACIKDNTPPETKLIPDIPVVDGRLLLGKNILIKADTGEPAKTHFCIVEEGGTCYPDKSTACGIQMTVDEDSDWYNGEGDYTIYYYSEDRAHNLEELKSVEVRIDTSFPSITSYARKLNNMDDARIVTLESGSEAVTCSGHLETEIGVPAASDNVIDKEKAGAGEKISRTYTNLDDETYYFVYDCRDKAGNNQHGEVSFSVDTNRIHNPKPFGPKGKGFIELSVETESEAVCRYSKDTSNFEEMTELSASETDNGFSHSATVSVQPGYHAYHARCEFNDGEVEGNKNDMIRLAYDNYEPEVELVSTFEEFPVDTSIEYGAEQTVMLRCRDSYIYDTTRIRRMDAGCKQTTYSIGDSEETFEGELSRPFSISTSETINYEAEDNVGNVNAGSLRIDIVEPEISIELYKRSSFGVSEPLDAVSYGEYEVKVSSEHMIASAELDAVITAGDSSYNVPSSYLRSEDLGKAHYFSLSITKNNIPEIEGGTLEINAEGVVAQAGEFCSISAPTEENIVTETKTLSVDTTMPSATLDPDPENYFSSYGYPLNLHDDIYYTNESEVFITGTADPSKTRWVNFYVWPSGSEVRLQKQYDMSSNEEDYPEDGDYSLIGFVGEAGSEYVIHYALGTMSQGLALEGELRDQYLEFSYGLRTDYGSYGRYYDVTGISSNNQQVNIDGPLEEDIESSDEVTFHKVPHPQNWFGEHIELQRGKNYFFMSAESSAGLENYGDKGIEYHTIVYDPEPPMVIGRSPSAGTINDNTPLVSILIKEPLNSGAPLDINSLKLHGIKSNSISGSSLEKETYVRGASRYYNISYQPNQDLDDGTYHVRFEGRDYAVNALEKDSVGPEWVFTINEDAPSRPVFEVIGGTMHKNMWFTRESPEFNLMFSEPVRVNAYYLNDPGNYVNVPGCYDTQETNMFTNCEFEEPLEPQEMGDVIEDEFQIIVAAQKVFSFGDRQTTGPEANIYLEKVVIDQTTPEIGTIYDLEEIRENYGKMFSVSIPNEQRDLKGEVHVTSPDACMGQEVYELEQVDRDRSNHRYYFKWKIPRCDPSRTDVPMEKKIRLVISDYAGNSAGKSHTVTRDFTPPEFDRMDIKVKPTRLITKGNYTTRETEVILMGNLTGESDDIVSVYVIPSNLTDAPEEKRIRERQTGSIARNSFEIRMTIEGEFNKEILNQLDVFLEDDAGNSVSKHLNVIADLQPPQAVSTRVS